MTRFDFPWPGESSFDRDNLERIAGDLGLQITLAGSLATLPGSHHYHFKAGKEAGTLELTIRPERQEAWVSNHRNRSSPLVEEKAIEFVERLAKRGP